MKDFFKNVGAEFVDDNDNDQEQKISETNEESK